jgi:hypothetical protein
VAVDLFQALGVDPPAPTPENTPTMRVTPTPSQDKGIDLFKALGVDQGQTFGSTNPLPAGAKPDARLPPPSTVSRGPDLPAWAGGGGEQPAREPVSVAPPKQKETLGNVAAAIPSGIYEGIARIPNIPTGLVNAASGVMHGLTGQDYGQLEPPVNTNPTGYEPQGKWAQGVHDASSAAANTVALGGVARAVTPFLPAGSAPAIASQALESPSAGVVAASAAGGAAEEPAARRVPEQYKPLARLGANLLAGGATAGAESAIGGAGRSAISPETAQLAQLGRDTYDIPITAAQMSGNRNVKRLDSILKSIPFSGHGSLDEEVQGAVNRAVGSQIGETATKFTPAVLQNARTRIGGVMDDVESRNILNFDKPFLTEVQSILTNAQSSMTQPEVNAVVKLTDGIMRNAQPGATGPQITGQTYGNLIHRGTPLDAAMGSGNSNIANSASQLKEALRGSLQRSLSGDDAAAYQQARTQWKNLVSVVEPALKMADVVGGASPSTGDINPVVLRGLVNRSYPDAVRRDLGEIPLNDIAKIGQRFLKEANSSQTGERSYWMKLLEHLGHGGGAGIAGGGLGAALMEHGMPSIETAALMGSGLASTGLAARGASKVLQSDALANRMIERGLAGAHPPAAPGSTAVPLATVAGERELEPPSTNPQTGLPQFSLEANQIDHKRRIADQIVEGIKDGSLASPAALKNHIAENRRELRGTLGGQGLQNITFVQAMMRRPGNIFSVVSNAPSPAVQEAMANAGIKDPHGLASLAITSPELAKILATSTSRQNLTKAGEAQVITGIQRAQGAASDDNVRSPAGMRNGLQRGSDMGKDRAGPGQGVPPAMAQNAGASL